MIKTIIKRDGSTEPLLAAKVNGWGVWAAQALPGQVDWTSAVMKTVASLPEVCSSQELQHSLIRHFLNENTWSGNRMAGRLYAATVHKDLHGKGKMPSIKQVTASLCEMGYTVKMNYSDEEYELLEKEIDHERDFNYAHSQIHHIRHKYALRNAITGVELESAQYVFMRMAMALAEDQPKERRIKDATKWYHYFSKNIINAPTPNYTNLGTRLNGYASCCLYAVKDTADSLAVGDHIAYKMTVMSAGIGNNLSTRSAGDSVRGGLFAHRGKLPYYRSLYGAVQANIKNGRNGACTTFFTGFDPEVKDLMVLKNPMTPADKQIRGMDYCFMANKFLGRKAAKGQDVFLFNAYTAPDLNEAFYSPDLEKFEQIYAKYEADESFKKTYVSARDLVISAQNQGFETGRLYLAFIDEINRHTPFKDPIRSSNLCLEICEPTEAYNSITELYTDGPAGYIEFEVLEKKGKIHLIAETAVFVVETGVWISAQDIKPGMIIKSDSLDGDRTFTVTEVLDVKREPEVAMCSLGAIVLPSVESEAQYEEAMYYTLLMIDKCIHKSDYPLPHIGYTAKKRLSAGVGIMSLAHHLARKGLNYSGLEGKKEIHRVAERHMYYAIKASLKLGKELGNAPWMHRTKWVDGWMPIDTYNRNVDSLVSGVKLGYDWEELRSEVKANGGIRNSVLVAHMPGESSSKASGGFNSVYPARDLFLMKTDGGNTIYWTAPENDTLKYELAWDIPTKDLIEVYSIIQKFTDQAISADLYRRIEGSEKVSTDEMLTDYFHMLKFGMKTRYYLNTKTAKAVVLDRQEVKAEEPVENKSEVQQKPSEVVKEDDEATYNTTEPAGCEGGFCSL